MKSVTVYATSGCNLRCLHCGVGADQDSPRRQQSTEEMKLIFNELAKGSVRAVTILGGEVTIYRGDLEEILDHADMVGIKVSINTNLMSFKAVQPLLEKPALRSLIVSLDGASAITHDAVRGPATFSRTTENIKRVASHSRVGKRELLIQVAYTMTGLNFRDAPDMLYLAKSLGATHLNVKNVKITGRAKEFSSTLRLDYRELLKIYSLLIANWMLVKGIELEVFVPPAFAVYLNTRFGLHFPTTEHHACGGVNTFSYVDLRGNHLPCPAMSYEENLHKHANAVMPEVNLITGNLGASLASPLFVDFERERKLRGYAKRMHPCNRCRFNAQCVQCVAEIIKGKETDVVDICKAVFDHGNEEVPGIREEVWEIG